MLPTCLMICLKTKYFFFRLLSKLDAIFSSKIYKSFSDDNGENNSCVISYQFMSAEENLFAQVAIPLEHVS